MVKKKFFLLALLFLSFLLFFSFLVSASDNSFFYEPFNFPLNSSVEHSIVVDADGFINVSLPSGFSLVNGVLQGFDHVSASVLSPNVSVSSLFVGNLSVNGSLVDHLYFMSVSDSSIVDNKVELGHGDFNYVDGVSTVGAGSNLFFSLVRLWGVGTKVFNVPAVNISFFCDYPLIIPRSVDSKYKVFYLPDRLRVVSTMDRLEGFGLFRLFVLSQDVDLGVGDNYFVNCSSLSYDFPHTRVVASIPVVNLSASSLSPFGLFFDGNSFFLVNNGSYDVSSVSVRLLNGSFHRNIGFLGSGDSVFLGDGLRGVSDGLVVDFVPEWLFSSRGVNLLSQVVNVSDKRFLLGSWNVSDRSSWVVRGVSLVNASSLSVTVPSALSLSPLFFKSVTLVVGNNTFSGRVDFSGEVPMLFFDNVSLFDDSVFLINLSVYDPVFDLLSVGGFCPVSQGVVTNLTLSGSVLSSVDPLVVSGFKSVGDRLRVSLLFVDNVSGLVVFNRSFVLGGGEGFFSVPVSLDGVGGSFSVSALFFGVGSDGLDSCVDSVVLHDLVVRKVSNHFSRYGLSLSPKVVTGLGGLEGVVTVNNYLGHEVVNGLLSYRVLDSFGNVVFSDYEVVDRLSRGVSVFKKRLLLSNVTGEDFFLNVSLSNDYNDRVYYGNYSFRTNGLTGYSVLDFVNYNGVLLLKDYYPLLIMLLLLLLLLLLLFFNRGKKH